MKNYHIYRRDENWVLKRVPGSRASRIFSTQSEAIKRGKSLAQKNKCLLVIHYTDMSINKIFNFIFYGGRK
mgnify:FL=1